MVLVVVVDDNTQYAIMSRKVGNERQIEQMCAFILQEAKEKAREIQIKVSDALAPGPACPLPSCEGV